MRAWGPAAARAPRLSEIIWAYSELETVGFQVVPRLGTSGVPPTAVGTSRTRRFGATDVSYQRANEYPGPTADPTTGIASCSVFGAATIW